ncbi:MAG: cadherin-like domain-containing protein, partial [Pseudomonadota bacterium]
MFWLSGGCSDGTTAGNAAPEITSEAGNEAGENTEYSYEVICTDPDGDALELDVGDEDTCGGMLEDNGDGTGTYTFTPDETFGGDVCDIEVTCSDGEESVAQVTAVAVEEDNQAPDITNLPATRAVHWAGDGSFVAEAEDEDIPANELAWSIDGHTCSFETEIDDSTG